MNRILVIIFAGTCLPLLCVNTAFAVAKNNLQAKHEKAIVVDTAKSVKRSNTFTLKTEQVIDTVTDFDGHVYHVVKIGKQRWLQENLKAAHFSDGSVIPEMEYNIDWPYTANRHTLSETGTPAWCYYERDGQNNYPYGKLYNWYAVTDARNVCPAGWHVPDNKEFQILSDYLGGDDSSGAHLKEIKLWNENDDKYADDVSGFKALPAGIRYYNGSYDRAGADGADFWLTNGYRGIALCRILYYEGANFGLHFCDKRNGLSVRCIANEPK